MKSAYERRWLGRTDIIPWPKMWNKQKNYQKQKATVQPAATMTWKVIDIAAIIQGRNALHLEKKKLSQ